MGKSKQTAQPKPLRNSRPARVHLICNAHLDPTWQWSWDEGYTEALSTFETVCDRMDEYPEFVFNHNESALYEFIQQHRPDLFNRIKHYVAQGRWIVSGGWYIQPDGNFPNGEARGNRRKAGKGGTARPGFGQPHPFKFREI